jgi:hypothetical protein
MKRLLRMNQLYRLINAVRVQAQPWHEGIFFLRGISIFQKLSNIYNICNLCIYAELSGLRPGVRESELVGVNRCSQFEMWWLAIDTA